MADTAIEESLELIPWQSSYCKCSASIDKAGRKSLYVDASKTFHILFFVTTAWRGLQYVYGYGYSSLSQVGQISVMSNLGLLRICILVRWREKFGRLHVMN